MMVRGAHPTLLYYGEQCPPHIYYQSITNTNTDEALFLEQYYL